MAWLNKQIEAYAMNIIDEVSLASYKARGKVELHTLLAREAIPKDFVKMPFGCTPGSAINRIWRRLWKAAETAPPSPTALSSRA